MAMKKAKTIELSEKQKNILETFAKGTHVQLNLKNRAKIILQAASGITNSQISKSLGIGRETVIRWRSRYGSSYQLLVKVEAEEPRRLKQAIIHILNDVQRPGAPATFTDTQSLPWLVLTPKNLDYLFLIGHHNYYRRKPLIAKLSTVFLFHKCGVF